MAGRAGSGAASSSTVGAGTGVAVGPVADPSPWKVGPFLLVAASLSSGFRFEEEDEDLKERRRRNWRRRPNLIGFDAGKR